MIHNWKSFNETREPFNTSGLYKNVYKSNTNSEIVIKRVKPGKIWNIDFELEFYKDHPNICAKIFRVFYKKGIIIQERLNTDKVKKELDYLTNKFKKIGYDNDCFNIIKSLIKNPNLYYYVAYKDLTFDKIKSLFNETDFILFNKWYQFINQIAEINPKKYKKIYLDFHSNNIGYDKEGNLKLLDI